MSGFIDELRAMAKKGGPLKLRSAVASSPVRMAGGIAKSVLESTDRLLHPDPYGIYADEDGKLVANQDYQASDATNVAGSAMTGSLPFAPSGAGILGTVKLPTAKSADPKAMKKAFNMIKSGVDPEIVWQQTGYHPLGKGMVGEISDVGTGWKDGIYDLINQSKKGSAASAPMEEVINHPELFKEYPNLGKSHVVVQPVDPAKPKTTGWYSGTLNVTNNQTPEEMYSTFLHELDHKLAVEAPASTGIQEYLKRPTKPHNSFEEYLQSPIESSARMRQQRFEKGGDNSPLYDLARLPDGSPIDAYSQFKLSNNYSEPPPRSGASPSGFVSGLNNELPVKQLSDREQSIQNAVEQGFRMDEPLYHGTLSLDDFKGFEPNAVRDDGYRTGGEGSISLSLDPGLASVYTNPDMVNPKLYDDALSAMGEAGIKNPPASGRVIPVVTRGKIWDYQNPDHVEQAIEYMRKKGMFEPDHPYNIDPNDPNGIIGPHGYDAGTPDAAEQVYRNLMNRGDWSVLEDDLGRAFMDEHGYSGGWTQEMGADNIIMFDPTAIRSPHAKFDPTKMDSSDLLASIMAGMGISGFMNDNYKGYDQ